MSHGLMAVPDAADAARGETLSFLFVGDGSERAALKSRRRQRGLSNVVMLPAQLSESIRVWYALADACRVPLRGLADVPERCREMAEAGRAFVARHYSRHALGERYERRSSEVAR